MPPYAYLVGGVQFFACLKPLNFVTRCVRIVFHMPKPVLSSDNTSVNCGNNFGLTQIFQKNCSLVFFIGVLAIAYN